MTVQQLIDILHKYSPDMGKQRSRIDTQVSHSIT